MPALSNLCRFFTSTTGTGIITVGSAVPGFLTPAQAGHSDGDVVFYAISDGVKSETGTGTFGSSLTTLTRSPVTSTGTGFNSAISLSGTGVQVFITPIASAVTISGGLTAGTLPKASAASTLVNSIVTEGSGKITIGTAGSGSEITLSNVADPSTGMWIRSDGSNTVISTNVGDIYFGYSGSTKNIRFHNGGTGSPSMFLDTSGRLGIGTTGPRQLLEISGAGSRGIAMTSTSGATNEKTWDWSWSATQLQGRLINDAYSIGVAWLVLDRSGTTSTKVTLASEDFVWRNSAYTFSIAELAYTGAQGATLTIGGNATTGDTHISVGEGRTGSGYAYLDLVGDTTYTDYGFRMIRDVAGANAASSLYHRGTGAFQLVAAEAAPIDFYTTNAFRLRIDAGGNIGVAATSVPSKLTLSGTGGQTALTFNTAGVLSDVIQLDSGGVSSGNGGAILFSAGGTNWRFAAIKGLVRDGGNNTRGDISFFVRPVNTDTTLSEAVRIDSLKYTYHFAPIMAVSTTGGDGVAKGQFHMSGDAAGTGYGSFWYNDGSNTYLLLTANGDSLGTYNSLRPFYVTMSSGLVSMGHGLNLTGMLQVLSSNGSTNMLRVINAGGQHLDIFDDTNEHIEASTALWINANTGAPTTIGGTLTVNSTLLVGNSITTNGAGAILIFNDRAGTSPVSWGWYATGGTSRLWNNVYGDRLSFTGDGSMYISNNIIMPNTISVYGIDTGGTARPLIGLNSSNVVSLSDGSHNVQVIGAILPSSDHVYGCGTPGLAWSNVQSYGYGTSSDRRLKEDIEDLPDECLDFVLKINPKQYKLKKDRQEIRHWGFVAQDIDEVMEETGNRFGAFIPHETGHSIAYNELTAVLWKACQELTARVAALESMRGHHG